MKLKIFNSITLCFLCFFVANAQDEFVGPIGYNSALVKHQEQTKSLFVYNNIVVNADTLSLPFVDDFSSNTLRSYDFSSNQVMDTIENATGSCVINSDFNFTSTPLMVTPSYSYFFDTISNQIDSIINPQITFAVFEGATCFPIPSANINFYPQPFTFTFDSATGAKLDSVAVIADTILENTTIYIASLDPTTKWIDNFAFYNTTFPIDPPSIGVATLDGLNEFGRPYNNTVVNPVGNADVLTSKPIDLSGLDNDSALFISFFVQAKGNGDAPNSEDSLVLEFKNQYENLWVPAWGITIDDIAMDEFKQFYVAIRDTNLVTGPRYFYEDFQFRFRNIASLSGNNDHWHIDYVRLDKNRAIIELDTVIRDVAFMYDYPNALATYSTLPWSQFQAGADSFAAEIEVPIRDNGQVNGISAGAFPIRILVTDSLDTDTVYELSGLNFNPTSVIKNQEITPNLDYVKPTFEGDSIFMNSSMSMLPTARNLIFDNDNISSQIHFYKIMAYDDGSAERAYGIEGNPNETKKFAYEFNVAHDDTLSGIQIHFSNIDEDVSSLVFSFFVWDSIQLDIPLSYDNVIGSIDNQKAVYIDEVNGFATFAFDTPILVTDKFYIGWIQTDSRNLQVGFDKNSTKGRDKMFVYSLSTWKNSSISENGSPMIRAVLDADFDFTTPIRDIVSKKQILKVYPNPTAAGFTIDIPQEIKDYQVAIFDLTGKQIVRIANQNTFDLSNYPSGLYFIQTSFEQNTYFSKIIKK